MTELQNLTQTPNINLHTDQTRIHLRDILYNNCLIIGPASAVDFVKSIIFYPILSPYTVFTGVHTYTCKHIDGVTYLKEWEQKANSKVGQPVYDASDHEGGRSVGLFKQFPCQYKWDAT